MFRHCHDTRVLFCALMIVCVAGSASTGESPPFTAHSGLDIAADAARSWSTDAQLIYVENDEQVSTLGSAARWGYLFYSESKATARGYSVRDGRILEASDLDFDFEAPPVADKWVDSSVALAAAEKKAGEKYRRDHGGRLTTMILIRGAFHEKDPDTTTWAMLYKSETEPALVVIVDATKGKVVRTLRG